MRPTAARLDGMPGPKTFCPWWGDTSIHKQRGVVVYTVSPFRQRGSKAIFKGWLFNGYRRLAAQVPYWIVPFAIGYGTYTWAKRRDAWQNSKAGHLALGGHH
ncbi:cytochrome b-c1 complex subunit 8 [Suillus paluster]|uniref:cytochrome b-c1 complex subunit 8 n=1 Tax=Suillus paluster TaxID=48578 RepID=UPI001B85EE07|nr:cytochrome b-c1 complex subunit 8 [Suillus paluster]KAG1737472.1 cytochrome b-c1 complex subunit 8 [Suillus paluster]